MDVEGSAANAAGVTSQGYLTRCRAVCQAGVCGDAQKPTSPCMPSASDCRRGRRRACRMARADVISPRPRPQADVTSRPPSVQRARGRGGRWEKPPTRRATPTAWGAAKCGRCAPAPPNVPPYGGRAAGCPPCGGGAEADAGGGPESPLGDRGRGPRLPCPRPLWAGDGDGRRAHGSRALCARPYA